MTERIGTNRGSARLNRTAPLTPPPPVKIPEPPRPVRAQHTGKLADESSARAGDVAPDAKKVDIDGVKVPSVEFKTETKGVDAPEEKKQEKKGFFGSMWDSAKSVASDTWDGVKKGAEIVADVVTETAAVVGAGIAETTESLAQGQGLFESIGDGIDAGGKKLYDNVVDPLLDKSVVGADNEFQDKGAGALGPILTNRLAVGESVDIRIEAGATIPTELVGAPNIKVDGGGTLKLKRVLAVDANNEPIMDPKTGKQETRIEVDLQLDGRVGGAYSANVGFNSTVQAGGYEGGVKAFASAEAEAGLTGQLNLKLRFNPDNAEEMGNLGAMMKATAATGAAATIPGIGIAFAAMSTEDYKRSMDSLPKHLESFGGEGGLYAQANASANLNVGIFKAEGGEEKPGAPGLKGMATDKAKEHVEGSVLEKLNLDVASLSAAVGGEVRVGASKNFRTGDSTVSITAQGNIMGQASVLGAGGGVAAEGSRKLDMVMGKDGQLKSIDVTQKLTKEQFLAMRTTLEDVYGRPIDDGMIARMSSSDTITVKYSVKPEVLQSVKDRVNSGDPAAIASAAGDVLNAAVTKDMFVLQQNSIIATHRDEFALRAGFDLALGAQIGVRGGVVLGHEQESVIK